MAIVGVCNCGPTPGWVWLLRFYGAGEMGMSKVGFTKIHTRAKVSGGSEAIVSTERELKRIRRAFQALFDQESLKRNGGQAKWSDCWNCHQKFALVNNLQHGDTCPYCTSKEMLK